MTLQVHPSGAERGGGASTVDAYPLPFSVGNKEIVGADPDSSLIIREEDQFPGSRTNVVVESSNNVTVGNRTVFNGDVTIFQNINRNSLRTLHAGTLENDVECKKKSQVASSNVVLQKPNVKDLKSLFKKTTIQVSLAGLLALMVVISLVIYFVVNPPSWPHLISPDNGQTDNLGDGIEMVPRNKWGARSPLNFTKINHPVKMVRILHTAGSTCKEFQSCAKRVAALQGWQVGSQGMPDLSYNYLIGGDGNVYIGRGPDVENEWNPEGIDIGYMGNFLTPYDKLTDKMEEAGKRLIARLRKEGKITPDYIVVPHNQTYNTQSPGQNIYSKMINWPHYDPKMYFV